ncbi:archaetidylserine synthase [Halogeometricum borinquense DSM 11551]|uniref:Archaetidylserine synthase n=1 Tax=Halogeometricum borinquense (strain ATCC 700274 / DSM 11551 / JCM 10706 / KCTC 4070 / PR3) TaxID=469382 RepID=E4NPJ2_HALBP|nr:protein sorting system archaetidylserine synthase [Halogeometricum borinquense]ADQ67662.1 archaetidylserine synthase [Halogeometricum borinquense DSM 11551]ELY23657.1 archaetidylserine synthase [Halogeometricum borinquense DSM 11551]
MKPRFVGKMGLADAVTVANAALGFFAAVAATVSITLAARLILLAAIADALDGVIARRRGGTAVGEYLDALADVASFGVAPALLVAIAVREAWSDPVRVGIALVGTALFVAAAVTRLGLYTAYDSDLAETEGVQTTLAATILSAGVLAGFSDPIVLVPLVYLLAVLMVTTITYPDLHAQDALVMGIVQALAILLSGPYGRRLVGDLGRGFAFGLLFLALAYLFFGPMFYWRRD